MFCPKCGSQCADTAAFCGNCGASLAKRPAAPATPATPTPAVATAAPYAQPSVAKPSILTNPKVLGIGALIILILLFLLIRAFACAGPSAPNLVDLATKDSSTVVKIVKEYKQVVVGGETYFTTDEKGLNDVYIAELGSHSSGMTQDDAVKELAKHDGIWFFQPAYNGDELDLQGLGTTNPTRVYCYTLVAKGQLSAKDGADLLAKVAPYDRCIFYVDSYYPSVYGTAKGNGCVSTFNAQPIMDSNGTIKVWGVTITTYAIAEDRSGASESSDFDYEYERFDAAAHADSYKK